METYGLGSLNLVTVLWRRRYSRVWGLLLVLDLPSFWEPEKFCCRSLEYWWCGFFPEHPCPPSFEFLCWPENVCDSSWTWIVMSGEVCDGIPDCILLLWWTPPRDLCQDLATPSRTLLISPLLTQFGLGKKREVLQCTCLEPDWKYLRLCDKVWYQSLFESYLLGEFLFWWSRFWSLFLS